jgi:hypothetical protein
VPAWAPFAATAAGVCMKPMISGGKGLAVRGKGHSDEHGTKTVKLGCGLECNWGSKRLRARVIAFVNDGAGLTGVVRRLFGRGG